MSQHDDLFRPEQVDEQIDVLRRETTSFDAHLIANLHKVCAEDDAIIEQVWTRLAHQAVQRRSSSTDAGNDARQRLYMEQELQKGPQPMSSSLNDPKPKRKRTRWLELLAAVIIIGVLIGGMAFLLASRQSSSLGSGSSPTATPTSVLPPVTPTTPANSSSGSLYLTTSDGIDRVDLTTGKIIWHAGSGLTGGLLVEQGIIIFAGGDTVGPGNTSNYYLEAVSAASGTKLWRKAYGPVYSLQGENGIVAVSSCSPDGACSIDGLKTSNGSQLWSYPSAQGTIWQLYQGGVVYGISYSHIFALTLSGGHLLWQKTLTNNQEGNFNPLISGSGLYFVSCNATKQTPGYETCTLFALNISSGAELWHRPFSSSIGAIPTLTNGVVYVASFQGTIYAFNASTGRPLVSYATRGTITNPLLSSG